MSGSRPSPVQLAALMVAVALGAAGCQLVPGRQAEFVLAPVGPADEVTLDRAALIIEGRLGDARVEHASVTTGNGTVVVRIPSKRKTGVLVPILAMTGRLELRPVLDQAGPGDRRQPFSEMDCGVPGPLPPDGEGVVCAGVPDAAEGGKLLVGAAVIDNRTLAGARVRASRVHPGRDSVLVILHPDGRAPFERLSARLAC